ncbi:MAG TPA: hypothetical protein VHJ34_05115 [Actinomycetota bacterium]|nr:hypothetical protein [Actinomycetota bacterium]
MTGLAAALAGAATALALVRVAMRPPPAALARTNVAGRRVGATLGLPLVAGTLAGAAVAAWAGDDGRVAAAVALVAAVMAAGGVADDARGDEPARGFRGHLGALRRGRVTGGVVKIAAGVVAGAAAGAIATPGRAALVTAALVALGANLVNLLDRAPGRAGKAWLVLAAPMLVVGDDRWAVAAAGMAAALLVCLWPDLRERAMLGDAGANPLGAVAGLGLALSLPAGGRAVALAVLAALNVLSERRSFSAVIASTRWLDALDRAGRRASP